MTLGHRSHCSEWNDDYIELG